MEWKNYDWVIHTQKKSGNVGGNLLKGALLVHIGTLEVLVLKIYILVHIMVLPQWQGVQAKILSK